MEERTAAKPAIEIDPVCGMKVNPEKAAASTEHAGRVWHFCGQGCFQKFQANPLQYDGSQSSSPKPTIAPASGACASLHRPS